jgi:hypothetical protein
VASASLIIANRNGESFLRQSIDSALNQTHATEVVIVDDGSVDNSRAIISSYGDRVVSLLRDWSGQASAINAGVAVASGTIVFLLDADDWSDPDRVSTIMPLFEDNSELLWARHSLRAVDEDDEVIAKDLYSFGGKRDEILRQILMDGKTPGTTSCLVLRKSYLEGDGRIPDHYTTYPDSYLLIRGALAGRGASLEAVLGGHRWHPDSFTAHDWTQAQHASFYLSLQKHLAEDARDIARESRGPAPIATSATWWQLKAHADWRKSGVEGTQPWFWLSIRSIAALIRSDLPWMKRLALAVRAIIHSALPPSLFVKAWWATHFGRPNIRRKRESERST